MKNDITKWDYTMSRDEYESLRSNASFYSTTLTKLMWDKGLINEKKDNDDWLKFRNLAHIDILKEKTKIYDECM